MDRGIFISMTGANASEKRVNTVSNNLANANTPGFKEALHGAHARYVVDEKNQGTTRVVADVLEVDPRQKMGAITVSEATHVALTTEKTGFRVQRSNGEEYATRDGAFTIDTNGVYRLGDDVVLDDNGSPLEKGSENQIGVVTLGKWTAKGFDVGDPVEQKDIKWGYIEQSNVDPAQNLVNLISASRSWDMQMQMIKRFDENETKANTILG